MEHEDPTLTNRILRIVIDARTIGSSTGRYAERLLHHLQRLDEENQYIVLVKPGIDWKPNKNNFTLQEVGIKDYTFSEQLSLWWKIRQLKPDITHFTMPQQPILPLPGRRVTTIHDLTMLRWHNISGNKLVYYIKLVVFRLLLGWVSRISDNLIVPTKWVKLDLIRTLKADPIKITITPESADHVASKSEPIKEFKGKKFLLFNGNVFPHKNVSRLIDAFALISATQSSLHLVIAGKLNDGAQELKQQTKNSKIHWLGYVSDENLRWLFENASAYVYPSLSEGFGLPGLEAMKYKLPLVSSSATCLPEVYGQAAEYFDPTSVEDMARGIRAVVDSEQRAQELVKLGQAQLRKYSWKRMAEQTLSLYRA